MKTKDLIICSIFASILCVFSVMAIPIGSVPISMGLFGVILVGNILNPKNAVLSVCIYILLGAAGMPVFSGFKGGIGVILGPTGGYITSYIITVLFISFFTRHSLNSKIFDILRRTSVSFAGVLLCYLFGTLWFMTISGRTFVQALSICVLPFIVFDLIKCVACAVIGFYLHRSLKQIKKSV